MCKPRNYWIHALTLSASHMYTIILNHNIDKYRTQTCLAWDASVSCWQHWLHGSISGSRLNCSSSLHELHIKLDENPFRWQNSTPTSDPNVSLHQISNIACKYKHTLNYCTINLITQVRSLMNLGKGNDMKEAICTDRRGAFNYRLGIIHHW